MPPPTTTAVVLFATALWLLMATAALDQDHAAALPKPGQNPTPPVGLLFDSFNTVGTGPSSLSDRRRLQVGDLPLDLVIYVQPGNTTGGIPSPQQMVVRAIKANGGYATALDTGQFLGDTVTTEELLHHVICAIGVNPPIVASARQRNMTTDKDLWSLLEFNTPRAEFYRVGNAVNGIMEATFEGMFINALGNGYTMQLMSRRKNEFPTYFKESQPFNVVLGPVDRLALYTAEGTATGGLPFRPQPTLAIVDRGNNICVWDQTTTIRVELMYSPTRAQDGKVGELLSTYGAVDYNHTVYNGQATFLGLNFDVAGYPYKLKYTANGPTGQVTTESINITVRVSLQEGLCSCAVVQLCSCAVVQLCSCAVVWKTRIIFSCLYCFVCFCFVVCCMCCCTGGGWSRGLFGSRQRRVGHTRWDSISSATLFVSQRCGC